MSNTKAKININTTKRSCLIRNKKEIFTNSEIMLKKRAFIHHYIGEGFEEGELFNALDNIRDLQNKYEAIENDFIGESKKEDKDKCEKEI